MHNDNCAKFDTTNLLSNLSARGKLIPSLTCVHRSWIFFVMTASFEANHDATLTGVMWKLKAPSVHILTMDFTETFCVLQAQT